MSNTVRLYHFTKGKHAVQNVKNRHLKLSFPNLVNDLFELQPFDFGDGEQARLLRRAWGDAIDQHSLSQGFISFSKGWSVPTMWGHYADNHKGICLGFDLPILRADGVAYAVKIDYVDSLHPIDDRVLNETAYNKKMVSIAQRTKSSHWAYEEEWRYWFSLSECEKRQRLADPDQLFFADFDANLVLREVIFGARSNYTRECFEALLQGTDNVEFITARPSCREFAMVSQRNEKLKK